MELRLVYTMYIKGIYIFIEDNVHCRVISVSPMKAAFDQVFNRVQRGLVLW
jgi:hypothetical protein